MSAAERRVTEPAGALDGVRIVELSRHMAAPYASVVLSDFGADVVKVESWPNGDPARSIRTTPGSDSDVFLLWNRGKRSIAADLRTAEGKDVVRRLVASADVFIESYRPGVAEQMGFGYAALSEVNPRLIYCSVSAFGQSGPLAEDPGTDPVVQAFSGVMSVTGERDGLPVLVGVPMADFSTAMVLSQAVLLGLVARERTGRGQKVDVSMLASMLFSLTTRLATYWSTGNDPQRNGSAHSVTAPYQAYQTADGYVVAGAWAEDAWPRFCDAIDRPDLAADDRFKSNQVRRQNIDELNEIIRPILASRTSDDWQREFSKSRALFGRIMTIPEVLAHPQAAGLVSHTVHPIMGELKVLRSPIEMSTTPGTIRRPPPVLGQHTEEVLREMDYSPEEIGSMFEAGVVGCREVINSMDALDVAQ